MKTKSKLLFPQKQITNNCATVQDESIAASSIEFGDGISNILGKTTGFSTNSLSPTFRPSHPSEKYSQVSCFLTTITTDAIHNDSPLLNTSSSNVLQPVNTSPQPLLYNHMQFMETFKTKLEDALKKEVSRLLDDKT